ncbi:MAG TPA: 16S rRNA (guanine(966)-N(2))-methyltransferase RsmD [Acidobacteriaceae bacterium]
MRVIAGRYRSRLLTAPRGMATRPTSDRLRETLFNVLAPRIEGAQFADLYAGTGALGIEALSRGAAHVVFVETAAAALAALRENLTALGIRDGYQVEQRSVPVVLRNLARRTICFDIVCFDPPWEDASAYTQTMTLLGGAADALLSPAAVVVAEHARRGSFIPGESYGELHRYRILEQGDAALSFYQLTASS